MLLAVALVAVRDAEAKGGIGVIITGGELGAHAAYGVAPFPAEGPYFPDGWPISTTENALVEPPAKLPQLAYDFYSAHVLPYQLADGPAQHYYPELRLVHQRRVAEQDADDWYEVTPETAASIEATIDDALAHKALGELENDVVVASLRGRHLTDVTYWLRPYQPVTENDRSEWSTASLSLCDECIVLRPTDEFIMRHYVETTSRPPRTDGAARARPMFVIEFEGIVLPPYGGIGGRLGFYDPPVDGEPGRFWLGDTYFETTAGFDAFVAEALARVEKEPSPKEAEVEERSSVTGGTLPTAMLIAGLAAASVAAGGAAVAYARRRGR